ncbi:unnamed protein product [Clavelina lepadiformis]|uniref:Uncharacterized protein n=1 Tax=Clavelina lepadiformis TaxID=159417 RepID=A0ABP0GI91_CLALP
MATVMSGTPHYPYETAGKSSLSRERRVRSLRNRESMPSASAYDYHHRGNRLYNHAHPAVVSTTQQLLCLTPSKSGVRSLKNGRQRSDVSIPSLPKFIEADRGFASVATFVTSDNVMDSTLTSPTPPVTHRSLPASKSPRFYYNHSKNTTPGSRGLYKLSSAKSLFEKKLSFKPPTPPVGQVRQPSKIKSENLRNYRAQLESYFGPRRSDMNVIARKMAPVLRVLPVSGRVIIREQNRSRLQNIQSNEKSNNDYDDEVSSQKRVRFTDQIGLPLVRNMTPNYRRKHSYILRWLETAGRSAHSLA